jgi:CDP-glycerol glycerophosphotransferase
MIYASDIDEYKKDRDFEIKLEDVPYPLATNNVELVNVIRNYDNKESKNNLNIFYDYVGLKESGKSCKELAKIINRVTV